MVLFAPLFDEKGVGTFEVEAATVRYTEAHDAVEVEVKIDHLDGAYSKVMSVQDSSEAASDLVVDLLDALPPITINTPDSPI